MSRLFPSSPEVVARHFSARLSAHEKDMNTHQATASQIHEEHTVRTPGELSYRTVWGDPQELRTWAQTQELADQSFRAMQLSLALRNRALMKAYAHHAYCVVRSVISRSFETLQLSLAQVAQVFTVALSPASHAPPGQLSAPNVLATCHASNAPGLSLARLRHWQERPE